MGKIRITAPTPDHAQVGGVGTDDHHAILHALDDLLAHSGNITDAQHGIRNTVNGHAHSALSGVTSDLHHLQLHAAEHQPGGGDVMGVDAAAGVGSLRTLGTGALQALAGDTSTSQRVFIPASSGYQNTAVLGMTDSRYSVIRMLDGVSDQFVMSGFLPFTPSSIDMVFTPFVSGNARLGFDTSFGASGESRGTHTDSIALAQYAMTSGELELVDIIAAFTGALSGDYFGIQTTRSGSDPLDTINAELACVGILLTP